MNVYIREIQPSDAAVSWKWRNDPEVWALTGRKFTGIVTQEIEENWIKDVLKQTNSKRFAICVKDTNQYIGNVQLTDIANKQAVFHIFIGEKEFWGKGLATQATQQLLDYAKENLPLDKIILYVKKHHEAAIKLYKKVGLEITGEKEDDYIMTYTFNNTPLVSICCITFNHAPYIAKCLDNLLAQQINFPVEIIVHDDASTDGTADVIRTYEKKYPNRFTVIYQTQNQYSQGKLYVYEDVLFPMTKGKYIAICEGDDYWTDPLKLQKQVDFLESHPDYVMVSHACKVIYTDDSLAWDWTFPHTEITLDDTLKSVTTHPNTWVFRRYDTPPVDYNSLPMGDDPRMCYLLTLGKSYYMNEYMSIYLLHQGGSWSALNQLNKSLHTYIFRMYIWNYYPYKRAQILQPMKEEAVKLYLARKGNEEAFKKNRFYGTYAKYTNFSTKVVYYQAIVVYLLSTTFTKIKKKLKKILK
jgi:RimJ/RimL family protein N-acetyltransferase/glycosyltransferase involved in cell wall biosynthesis